MKDFETILAIGAVAIVGYAAYRLVQPITSTVGGVGQGVTSLTQGTSKGITSAILPAGQAVGQIATSSGNLISGIIEAPIKYWDYITSIGESAGRTVREWFT